MDRGGQFRKRWHIVQESGRRTPVETVAGVHGSGGPADGSIDPGAVGEARVGRGVGVGESGDENGRAGGAVPVRQRGDGTAPDQRLLRDPVLADGPQQGRVHGGRDVRRTPWRKGAQGLGPGHRVG